jgi:hypothetical protein
VTGYGGLDRLPDYQNVPTSFGEMLTANVRLGYENRRASLGAVGYEKGHAWQLATAVSYVNSKVFPNFYGTFDYGFPTLMDHSAIWLRNAVGYSPGDREEPFSNFYFGGFGNNWIDHAREQRYREYYSFPGVELNQIEGRNFAKMLLEWNLPPLRFRRLGTAAFYATWARLSFFSSGIVTNLDAGSPHQARVANLGAQVDLRMALLWRLKITVSSGYAVAVVEDQRRGDEFMFSVKIL